jgi:hypothetical protein
MAHSASPTSRPAPRGELHAALPITNVSSSFPTPCAIFHFNLCTVPARVPACRHFCAGTLDSPHSYPSCLPIPPNCGQLGGKCCPPELRGSGSSRSGSGSSSGMGFGQADGAATIKGGPPAAAGNAFCYAADVLCTAPRSSINESGERLPAPVGCLLQWGTAGDSWSTFAWPLLFLHLPSFESTSHHSPIWCPAAPPLLPAECVKLPSSASCGAPGMDCCPRCPCPPPWHSRSGVAGHETFATPRLF